MRKGMFLLIFLIFVIGLIVIIKDKSTKTLKAIPMDKSVSFNEYKFYKPEYQTRYDNYKLTNPNLLSKDIVLRVNIGLDHGFYTETEEVTKFDILMLVNKYHYVTNNFIPDNLVDISEYSKPGMKLNEECKNAFIKMAHDAEIEGYTLRAISTYRTLEYQENLYNNYMKKDGKEKADTYSARPGYSEHHTGLAIDLDNKKLSYTNFENTKEFNWMMDNAYKYGFILRYPKDSTITGYIYEPWHYRYVGLEVAKYIKEHNITFEEYYYEFLDK